MEEPTLFRDHLGVWMIRPPKDMPIEQIEMLQENIARWWDAYPGDPHDVELFWDFLTESMANVPRETSMFEVDVIYRVNGGALRTTAQRTVQATDWSDAIEQVKKGLRAAMPHDVLTFSHFSGGTVADGGPVVTDVPRETSGGDDAPAS